MGTNHELKGCWENRFFAKAKISLYRIISKGK